MIIRFKEKVKDLVFLVSGDYLEKGYLTRFGSRYAMTYYSGEKLQNAPIEYGITFRKEENFIITPVPFYVTKEDIQSLSKVLNDNSI